MYILFENFRNIESTNLITTYFRQRFMVIACKGEWVHCEIVFNEMQNQRAFASDSTGMMMKDWENKVKPEHFELYPLPSHNWKLSYDYCKSQEGKVYDRAGVVGMMYGIPTYNDNAVFCSELSDTVIKQYTGLQIEKRPASLVSPLMLRRSIINQNINSVPLSVLSK